MMRSLLDRLELGLSPAQLEMLERHWQLLLAANREFNLTAISDPEQAAEKHYADSLLARPAFAGRPGRALDIGSGGGFPGLVLAVACPDWDFTLLEATGKKCAFLERCGRELGLSNVRVLNCRAEEAGRDPALRAGFDLATARAVAPLAVLAEYALPLLRLGGRLAALKGAGWEAELAQAEAALALLGGGVAQAIPQQLPRSGDQRALLLIEKLAPTPDKYPRRPGIPQKRPLKRAEVRG